MNRAADLGTETLRLIAEIFHTVPDAVTDIAVLKKGMTNRSFCFSVNGEKFIIRIPGEGTDRLINRMEEAAVYAAISGSGLCDEPVYIDPHNGYKITRYLEQIRVADAQNTEDVRRCMEKLRGFHAMGLRVAHRFDIFGQIEFYESLRNGRPGVYGDYQKTKDNIYVLKKYIDSQEKQWTLTHIDAVPDNFLFHEEGGCERLQLTDWEYAGMQDPHVDIAMFCIYSFYEKDQVDHLIDLYFEGCCPGKVRAKIYCYIAACGLLWSNWCEYKQSLGIEFGEYSRKQYSYAKEYYDFARQGMRKSGAIVDTGIRRKRDA